MKTVPVEDHADAIVAEKKEVDGILSQPDHDLMAYDSSKKYHPYKTPQRPEYLYPLLACGFFTVSMYLEKDMMGTW
jgi:hypothetical protein